LNCIFEVRFLQYGTFCVMPVTPELVKISLAILGDAIQSRISFICVTSPKVAKASKVIVTVMGIF
jgi:hypothetical protein